MATIVENIQTLRSIKSDIKNAITGKGGSVGNDFKTYAQAITNLPSGGGGNEDLINLIERDIITLNIPDGTTKIGNSAFYNCLKLISVTIPNSVTIIDEYAFQSCRALTEVTIGNGVTSIGHSAFNDCRRLKSITIKATTPPTLGSMAFYDTNNCPIYVPAESVNAYKTATNWTDYANRIIGSAVIEGGPSEGGPSGGGPSGPIIN